MSSWYTPPTFVPIKYVPASEKEGIRAKEILRLRAVAHAKKEGPYEGGFTNHWCLYLQTGDEESVRIDAQPNLQQKATVLKGGFKADVIISKLEYAFSHNSTHNTVVAVTNGLKVGHVMDLLTQSGHDRYEFLPEGVGCRKWMADTLALMTQKGWIDGAVARNDIGKLWPEGTPLRLGGGEYYKV